MKAAAEALYAWLNKDKSPLRQLIALLSGGGIFYVAQCHEKTHRAYIQEKRVSKEVFQEMNTKRLCTGGVKKQKGDCMDLPE